MIGNRRHFVRHPWLIEILSGRVFDPFAVFVRTKCVAADRRLRSDGPISILGEPSNSTIAIAFLPGYKGLIKGIRIINQADNRLFEINDTSLLPLSELKTMEVYHSGEPEKPVLETSAKKPKWKFW